jgi:hypothetical protein
MELPVTVTWMAPEREDAFVDHARPGRWLGPLRPLRGAIPEGTTDAA